MARLIVRPPGQPSYEVPLGEGRVTLGRSVRSDVYLDDPFSSRLHAELRPEGEGWVLADLGSANGTRFNGSRIRSEVLLGVGDLIHIGETEIELVQEGSEPSDDTASHPGWSVHHESSGATSSVLQVLQTVREATGPAPEIEVADRRQDLFAVMSQVGIALLAPWSLEGVLEEIVRLIFEGVPADRAFLLLADGAGEEPRCRVARTRDGSTREMELRVSSSVRREVMTRRQSVLTSDALQDERFRDQQSIVASGVRAVMAVPIAVEQAVLGMIYVDSPIGIDIFTEDDLRLLTTIATVAAIKIENARLVEERIESERLQQQLASARQIQRRLLPRDPPPTPGYGVTGTSLPCFEVGGDYYDFVLRDEGRLLFALGDVVGKGLDAAMMMSSLHAAMRAQAEASGTLAEAVARVNRYLHDAMPRNKFITLFAGVLELDSHRLTYTNAGQIPPFLVRRDGSVLELERGGYPLAIDRSSEYQESIVELEPGDVVFCRSDGLDEAVDESGEEFGEDRLRKVLLEHRELDVCGLWDRVDEALETFLGAAPPVDDMTALVVKREQ